MFHKTKNDLYKDLEDTFEELFPYNDNLEYINQLKFCQDSAKILNKINIFDYELSDNHDFKTKSLESSCLSSNINFFKNWNVNFETVPECNLNETYKSFRLDPLILSEERIVTKHD